MPPRPKGWGFTYKMINIPQKTVQELVTSGAKWVDAQWKDMLKTPDGMYWRPAPNEHVSMPANDTMMVLLN